MQEDQGVEQARQRVLRRVAEEHRQDDEDRQDLEEPGQPVVRAHAGRRQDQDQNGRRRGKERGTAHDA